MGQLIGDNIGELGEAYWAFDLERNPTTALLLGEYQFADRMEDLSREAEDEAIEQLEGFAAAAEALDAALLAQADRISRGVLIAEAVGAAGELRSRMAELAVDPSGGFHVALLQLASQVPVPNAEVADAIVGKWSRLGTTFDQAVHRLRHGIAKDRTPPRISVEKSIDQIVDYLESDLDTDPFLGAPAPPAWTDAQTAAWRQRLRDTVTKTVRPAYASYLKALRDEVLPKSRPPERTGLPWLADGEEAYVRAVKRHTSLDLTPLEIHQIGLDEIEALRDEYRELGGATLGTSGLDDIYSRLRDDPELRFADGDAVLSAAQTAMDRARAAIPDWFGCLPKAECVMAEITGPGAEDAPIGYYLPPATDGSRPGTYFINTTEPGTRTRFESEALAFHESIPGHHLQLAIAQELDDVPNFRKHALVTVYVEGWGLYTERLADEMGLYSNDLARLGILSFDSWRAGRLVVDTGIHALGWSRQDAIDFLASNSPQALNNIENEVDRYIGWPGQALAYKLGQRELFRVRDLAKERMGSRFDIKGFHDVVLGSGPVPLGLLGKIVEEWIAA